MEQKTRRVVFVAVKLNDKWGGGGGLRFKMVGRQVASIAHRLGVPGLDDFTAAPNAEFSIWVPEGENSGRAP